MRATTPIKRLRFLAKRAIGDVISITEAIAYSLSTGWLKFTEALTITDIVSTFYSYVPLKYLYESLTISANTVWSWVSRRVENVLDITDAIHLGLTDVDTSATIADNTEEIGFITDGDSTTVEDAIKFIAKLIEATVDVADEIWYQLETATAATIGDAIDSLGMILDDITTVEDALKILVKIPEAVIDVTTSFMAYGIHNVKSSLGLSDSIDFINWFRTQAISASDGLKIRLTGLADSLNAVTTARALGLEDSPTTIGFTDSIDKDGWGTEDSTGISDDMDCEFRCQAGCDYCDTCQSCNQACYRCDSACYSCNVCDACASCNVACVTCEKCDTACNLCFTCNVTCYTCERCDGPVCYSCATCNVTCYTCEQCYDACYDCVVCEGSCYSCDRCDVSCYKCDNCQVCDFCEECNTSCYYCDSCEGSCYTCDRCDANCYACDTCDASCYTCQKCNTSCYNCVSCEREYSG